MTVKDLTDNALVRLHFKLYSRIERDCFGADWRTLRITKPGLAAAMSAVIAERKLRAI